MEDALSQKRFYTSCHSGLDPESSLFNLGFPLEFIPTEIEARMTTLRPL